MRLELAKGTLFLAAGLALVSMGVWSPRLIFQTLQPGEMIIAGAIAAFAGCATFYGVLRGGLMNRPSGP
jgi:hypothetical protein